MKMIMLENMWSNNHVLIVLFCEGKQPLTSTENLKRVKLHICQLVKPRRRITQKQLLTAAIRFQTLAFGDHEFI
ncbi:unnamed protein product [Blepharisma stoltei]|uniref:Uncharacterized protein n=1 Tax=Blepharisma stoltei TaxID=1481888 RepID=A0AAU9JH62_9CILI|nr:unnamed protein product [Blepharisma stoltei]